MNQVDESLKKEFENFDFSVEPERDLWPGIESLIDANDQIDSDNNVIALPDTRKNNSSLPNWLPYSIAASLILCTVSILFNVFAYQKLSDMNTEQYVQVKEQLDQMALLEQQHSLVRAEINQFLLKEEKLLDPNLIIEIRQALHAIDSASRELKAGLNADPENTHFSDMLNEAYQQEAGILKTLRASKGTRI